MRVTQFFVLSCSLLTPQLFADDTEVYDELAQCLVDQTQKYRFVFIVDNSGSMSSWEFTQSRNTINTTIDEVLNSDLQDIQVAVVQYGTNHFTREHKYDISVSFTNKSNQATNWNRKYGPGSRRNHWDLQDHQPASLSKMRLDNVYAAGGGLDVSDATNVQFVFFTDAYRDIYWGCCSSLVNSESPYHGDLSNVLPGFGEYDALKSGSVLPNGLQAQFTILHVPPNGRWGDEAAEAAAAIASPGGSYIGDVEYNSGDPEGPGAKPRRYVQGTFGVSDSDKILELIQQVIEEVKDATYTNVAPAVSVNAFNELQHRDELYFSVFEPGKRPRWGGNVKKFRINNEGIILDANDEPAIDSETGSVAESARSYWSSTADGAAVDEGGYRGQLNNSRNIYTDRHALENETASSVPVKLNNNSKVDLELLGMAEESDDTGLCVLIGDKKNNTLTINESGVEVESALLVEAGGIRLSFTTSKDVSAKVTLIPKLPSVPVVFQCEAEYDGGSTVHSCEFTVDTDIESIDVYFESEDAASTVEYLVEYNIPAAGAETSCGTPNTQRKDYLTWLVGEDVFNEDADDSNRDAHRFVADPLHSKPFVVTYSGSALDDAKEVMFVTDNLGMLHAIDPANDSGEELWAYLPAEHLDNVKKVVLNKAGQPKVYGLDGQVTVVQRENVGSSSSSFELREVKLYIGERRGGRSYHSLDVTNAASSGNNWPMIDWKITGGESAKFDDLGQTWSTVLPNRLAYNCDDLGQNCDYREVLIFSGGYDPAYDDASQLPTETLGNALYIVDLATGGDEFFWSAGNNDDLRDSHSHDLNLAIQHSVAATPTPIDSNGDGAVDILFGLDISGKIWRIDFNGSASTATSTSAMGGNIADLQGFAGIKRFYNTLDVSRANPRGGADRFMIVTGSGYRAHPLDMDETDNKVFLVFDPNTSSMQSGTGDDAELYRYFEGDRAIKASDLVESVVGDEVAPYGYTLTAIDVGEKFLQPSLTINGTLIISSYVPPSNEAGECSIGSGRSYFLKHNNLQSKFSKPFVDLSLPGIPPETSILRLPEITVCIGTACASAESLSSSDNNSCDSASFTAEEFGSDFAAAVAAASCGLDTGRAYRAEWVEY